jgi:hypothetical protein
MLYCLNLFGEKSDYSVKNHQIILINFWIIYIWRYFAYHILYRIQVISSKSDILIRRIPIYRIWILKYGFGDGFGTEIILSVYIPRNALFNIPWGFLFPWKKSPSTGKTHHSWYKILGALCRMRISHVNWNISSSILFLSHWIHKNRKIQVYE